MLEDIVKERKNKLNTLVEKGINPYPPEIKRDISNFEAIKKFNALSGKKISLAGRIKSLRKMGAMVFSHIEDGTGKFQILFKKNVIGTDKYDLFIDTIDIGDFIEVKGKLFLTKTKEKTLEVELWKILCKSIRPIPSEYYGLKEKEKLLRKRYLDLLANSETRELFIKKNVFWKTIRDFLVENGFLEVDTPVLENAAAGADARPFITHHNILDRDFYLRISLELPLKRLLVGGYEKVFEIGKIFRNEGIDAEHLQDYIMAEFYWAYADMKDGMRLTEKLFKKVVYEVTGGYGTKYDNQKINWKGKWPEIDYFTIFKEKTGIDLNKEVSLKELAQKADELMIKHDSTFGKGRLIDAIHKKTVRPKLIQPCFLVGHPLEVSPLAKKDPVNNKKVLRFQIVAGGSELCNGFSELNDPIDQKKRFEEQLKLRQAGDEEAQMMDEDFIESLEYGMPPAVGVGLSERLFAFIMNKSVRETVIFPPMREK